MGAELVAAGTTDSVVVAGSVVSAVGSVETVTDIDGSGSPVDSAVSTGPVVSVGLAVSSPGALVDLVGSPVGSVDSGSVVGFVGSGSVVDSVGSGPVVGAVGSESVVSVGSVTVSVGSVDSVVVSVGSGSGSGSTKIVAVFSIVPLAASASVTVYSAVHTTC
jgi:hypothetical protein